MNNYKVGDQVSIRGRDCLITLVKRPHYCDRGNWLAQLEVINPRNLHIDGADGWPRYYFDLERAKLEVLGWLDKREQIVNREFVEEIFPLDLRHLIIESL